jgi:hypothetical protein
MNDIVVLIHTIPDLIGVFNQLADEVLPGVEIFHILDEPLLEGIRRWRSVLVAATVDHIKRKHTPGSTGELLTLPT